MVERTIHLEMHASFYSVEISNKHIQSIVALYIFLRNIDLENFIIGYIQINLWKGHRNKFMDHRSFQFLVVHFLGLSDVRCIIVLLSLNLRG